MPTRGTPGRSSWTPACCATQLSMADTSRPSSFGLSTSASPPEWPKPRGSHVKTLNPPCQSWAMLSAPWIPACDVSVSPDEPQPGPMSTVGCERPAGPSGSGNQWIRMVVPSKEVRS